MKKIVIGLFVLGICIVGVLFWVFQTGNSTLAANKSGSIQVDDFILHIRVENFENGIQVFRSIQYVGEETIEIAHHTPLVSVSLKNKNHDFTGSPVVKKMDRGNSYHPQSAITFKAPKKGEYKLYCKAKFAVNGEEIVIDHTENLIFK